MSTVQEQILDSPTVPSKYINQYVAAPTCTEESGHGRSSSAPTERAAASSAYPPFAPRPEQEESGSGRPVWMNRQAAASTQTLHGLGLSLPTDGGSPTNHPNKRPRQKPNLRIEIRNGEPPERPPPPPPKSPRHEYNASAHTRTPSAQSQTSTQEYSPLVVAQSMAYTAVKPTFVHHNTARSIPISQEQMKNALPHSRKASTQSSTHSADVECGRNLKSALSRKPIPPVPQTEVAEKPVDGVRPPSSKFSVMTSLPVESGTEGEKTPKVSMSGAEIKPMPLVEARSIERMEQMTLRAPEYDDLAPPTPRKDNFSIQTKGDEKARAPKQKCSDEDAKLKAQRFTEDAVSNKVQSRDNKNTRPKMHIHLKSEDLDVSKPPPTPRKDNEAMSRRLAEPAKLLPPQREPPKRPESPQPVPRVDCSGKNSTPEMPSRAITPEPRLKALIVDKGPTPDLPDRAGTPVQDGSIPDPRAVMADLTKQTEALHKRYATLRSDRQKLSTSIVASLKEQKAGPEYANTLLDQHLSLAAINSSMDICFAKLKSLECRKEAAMAAIIADNTSKEKAEKSKKVAGNSSQPETSTRPGAAVGPTPSSGTRAKSNSSPSKLRKDSAHPEDISPKFDTPRKDSDVIGSLPEDREKRNTVIKASPEPTITGCTTAEPEELYNTDVEEQMPKKIRIKGAKAAQILGLMKEAADGRPSSPGITLPDDLPANSSRRGGPAIEVHIPTAPLRSMPPYDVYARKRRNPSNHPSPRRNTGESASSASPSSGEGERSELHSRAGSSVESAPEEQEIQTPKDEDDAAASEELKGRERKGRAAKRAMVQTIQVYFDDEILDYYHQAPVPIKK